MRREVNQMPPFCFLLYASVSDTLIVITCHILVLMLIQYPAVKHLFTVALAAFLCHRQSVCTHFIDHKKQKRRNTVPSMA